MTIELSEEIARKVLKIVDAGLVRGVGIPEPGKMCVEAAVCFALGEPHGDRPSCVGPVVRLYKTHLNDSCWSSNAARAKGLRALSIAQLGSDKIDQRLFTDYIAMENIRRILPIVLLATANHIGGERGNAIRATIEACENATDVKSARIAVAEAARRAAGATTAYTARALACISDYNTSGGRDAAFADVTTTAAFANVAALSVGDCADDNVAHSRDNVLALAADIGVEALMACGCRGCEWLWLIEETT